MASAAAMTRHKVLIVEDEESTRLLLASMVSAELQAEVQLAGTSEQALRLIESQHYDAIMMDLMMPGIDGFALLHRVRASAPNAGTPVIIISADQDPAERCLAAGASAYLVKPVRRAELSTLMKQLIAARAAQK